jgi:hypothetical protein
LQLNQELTVPQDLQFAPFLSENIEKGLLWFQAVEKELESSEAAILAVTPENADSPWMHYEAGAIANRLSILTPQNTTKAAVLKGRLFTYLFGMDARDLRGPLAAYQSTTATFDDSRALVRQLLGIGARDLGGDDPAPSNSWSENSFRRCWNDLAGKLQKSRSQPFCDAVGGFEEKFQRLTFQEPVDFCHRQAWIDRIKGCHEVLTDLRDNLNRVQDRCRPYEAELYQQLLTALDGYEMTMHAYLVTEKRFELGKLGQLTMPEDVQWACEDRRKIVKDAVAALLDPGRAPVFDESPAFANLETFAEKKNAIHRKRAAIRAWMKQHQGGMVDSERLSPEEQNEADTLRNPAAIEDWQTSPTLPPAAEFARARMSDWDFDRVVYYVTHSECLRHSFQPKEGVQTYGILPGPEIEASVCAWLEDEVQKIGASPTPKATRLPLNYALCVLEDIVAEQASLRNDARLDASTVRKLIPILKEIVRIEENLRSQVGPRADSLLKSLVNSPAATAA